MPRTQRTIGERVFLFLLFSSLLVPLLPSAQPQVASAVVDEGSPYGLNMFKSTALPAELPQDYNRKAYEYLRDAGIKWVRDSHGRGARSITSWARVEPQKDQWTWWRVDRDLALLNEYGLAYLGFLGKPPGWAQLHDPAYDDDAKNPDGDHPNDLSRFADYVTQMVSRYGCNGGSCQVKYWEVGNEPNNNAYYIDHPGEYASLLRLAYQTIKSVDPNAKVLIGGLGSTGIARNNFHDVIFGSHEAAEYFDIYNFHAYGRTEYNGSGDPFVDLLDTGLAIRSDYCPNKPVWLTETGSWSSDKYHNWISYPEREEGQANDLEFARYSYPFDKGIEKVFWFNYADGSEPTNRWDNGGILQANLNPKPAYYAYQRVTGFAKPLTWPYGNITGFAWVDGNGDGKVGAYERKYSCNSASQSQLELALYRIGSSEMVHRHKQLSIGVYEFEDLDPRKYHLRIIQLPVCDGQEYEITQWRIDTAPSNPYGGWAADTSRFDEYYGTRADSGDTWTNTPFWSLNVIGRETTHVYLGMRPKIHLPFSISLPLCLSSAIP